MDYEEWVRGMESALCGLQGAGTRRPAGRRIPALMALVFVGAVSLGLL